MSEGAFVIEGQGSDDYNIKPDPDLKQPIPPDQRELQQEIYRTRGTLKLLAEQGVFRKAPEQDGMLQEFKIRLRQIAETGLVGDFVQMEQAVEAHEDLRRELLTRKGNAVKYHYLAILASWTAAGLVLGTAIYALVPWAGVRNYGLLVIGAVVGAWLSVAATRWSVAFEDLSNFLDSKVEPAVRMLFVVVLAFAIGVALQTELLKITLGEVELKSFESSVPVALLLGLVSGVSERALATRFIEGARTLAAK
jgi:hypothetical protein